MNGRCCEGRAPLRSRPCAAQAAPCPVASDRTVRVVVRGVPWPQALRTLIDTIGLVRHGAACCARWASCRMDRNENSSCTHETRLFSRGGGVAVRVSRRCERRVTGSPSVHSCVHSCARRSSHRDRSLLIVQICSLLCFVGGVLLRS